MKLKTSLIQLRRKINFSSYLLPVSLVKRLCYLFFITACCFLLPQSLSYGQKTNPITITGDFNNISAPEFIKFLEKQTGFRYFYDPFVIDSVKINISVKDQPLEKVLGLAFNGIVDFAVDKQSNVFLTKGQAISAELPPGFFDLKKENAKKELIEVELPDYNVNKAGSIIVPAVTEIGNKERPANKALVNVAGHIRDGETGEPVSGAYINIPKAKVNVVADQFGYYSLSLPKGKHTLKVQSVGMKESQRELMVYGDGQLDINLRSQVTTLKKVTVTVSKTDNVSNAQMGVQKINIKTIKQVPVVFGEADLLKVVLTLPGVKTVGESSVGLNVRGGSADQNLILFNDATIFNPSHFFGLFSAFNPEIVKDLELYKSSIPAKYGGRLSSVLSVNSREGNKKKLSGSAGIGLLTSRLQLEGPLVKDKTSFIVGARTTYANWFLKLLPDEYKNSKASFHDYNLNMSHNLNENNDLYLTGYLSKDRFNLNSKTRYSYGNQNLSLKWKHIFNNKLNVQFAGGIDNYKYDITAAEKSIYAYRQAFQIQQTYFKSHFNYNLDAKHALDFGLSSIYYKLHPGSYMPEGSESLVIPDVVPEEQALETAVYVSDRFTISPKLSVEGGFRYSIFNYLGPRNISIYAPDLPKTVDNIIEEAAYSKGKIIKTYTGPEVRASVRYAFSDSFSVKFGYNTQRQYIHLLSNVAAISPIDIWKLSDPNIKPQYGDQVSVGLYKNLNSNTIETSIEVYYKKIKSFLDYKSGAVLVMNHHVETDVISTKGKAYGLEVLVRKTTGKLNGWVSYTYSRILLQANDPLGEIINGGKFYPANYDKPHDFTFIGNYRISHRLSFSLNTTYSTGRPITLPIGRFYYSGGQRSFFTERNAYRIPDYLRTDISMNIEGNHKLKQKTHNSWTLGVYNLAGRKNPYSVYYITENGYLNGYKLSIFGSAIPYINLNIRF